MLHLTINKNGTDRVLRLEHSLKAIAEWEAEHHKTFLSKEKYNNKTDEEMLDYIRKMILNYEEGDLSCLTDDDMMKIGSYIKNPRTSINFPNHKDGGTKDAMTHEFLYYSMIERNIPFETQYWHINDLLNLIAVIDIKNKAQSKEASKDYLNYHNQMNRARRGIR